MKIIKSLDIILGIVLIIAFILVIIVIIMYFNSKNKKVTVISIKDESILIPTAPGIDYNNPALYHSTKSVDGEQQFNNDTQWKSQPSKCFDCEAQMEATCGDACVYNATKQKLF